IGREVAVKTLHLSAEGTGMNREELISRFQTEARAAGLLSNPNIVTVFDAGEEEGLFYITMELVVGRSLQAMLDQRQTFPLPRALRILEQACGALDYAHQHNIVHRDVKPANLMIAADDVVKITDFGTAKILQFGTTQTAHIVGTPSYMSPEQIKGKPVDGRSDIFSLGVILYELVTGEKPFPGQNITTVIYKIVNEEPIPPRQLDASIHPGLSAVIQHALVKEPAARFQTCADLLEALRNYRNYKGEADNSGVPAPRADGPAYARPRGELQPHLPGLSPAAMERPEAARVMSVPTVRGTMHGTVYSAEKKKMGWASFWISLLLLGVIGGVGTYVWPYVREVWSGVRTEIAHPAEAAAAPAASYAGTAPATAPEKKNAADEGPASSIVLK
ncbi:MAG: serine/threonine-protein kinase, partial [Bryobacteraceae bacterium]